MNVKRYLSVHKAMRAAEFRRAVRGGGTNPRWALDAACDHFISALRTDRADVALCLALASRFAVSHAEAAHLPAPPGLLLATEQLVDVITPEIERVRRGIFGAASPPFRSLGAAAKWIGTEASMQPKRSEAADDAEPLRLMREAARLAAEAAQLGHQWASPPGWRTVTLAYAKPDADAVSRVATWPGSKLARLAMAAQEMATGTGFAEEAVVAYVLVGIRPVLPVARIVTTMRSTRGIGAIRWVSVELHSAGVTPRQFLDLYDHVRAELGVAPYAKPLTSEHQALLETVKRLGDEPPAGAGRGAFWERVRAAMNQAHGTKYTTWRGPEMRYRRLITRIKTNGGQA